MALDELKADAKLAREKLAKNDGVDPRQLQAELVNNIWPWMEALVDAIRDDVIEPMADLGEAIDELIENEESLLHPELAAMILGVFESGKLIAAEYNKLLEEADELTQKRGRALVHAYLQGATVVAERVAEVVIEPDIGNDAGEDQEPEESVADKIADKIADNIPQDQIDQALDELVADEAEAVEVTE